MMEEFKLNEKKVLIGSQKTEDIKQKMMSSKNKLSSNVNKKEMSYT